MLLITSSLYFRNGASKWYLVVNTLLLKHCFDYNIFIKFLFESWATAPYYQKEDFANFLANFDNRCMFFFNILTVNVFEQPKNK